MTCLYQAPWPCNATCRTVEHCHAAEVGEPFSLNEEPFAAPRTTDGGSWWNGTYWEKLP